MLEGAEASCPQPPKEFRSWPHSDRVEQTDVWELTKRAQAKLLRK